MVNNFLLHAKIMHKRNFPSKNLFCYNSSYIVYPLFKKDILKNFLFSINKVNVFSFYDKDHGTREKNSDTKAWALEKFSEVGIKKEDISEIILLTYPRCLLFVFNPASFYFCLDFAKNIVAIIVEVNNTFSQTHSYIINEKDFSPIIKNKTYKANKEFFVSPFFKREGEYEFRFSYSEEKIAIFVNYLKNDKLMFETSLIGVRKAFSNMALLFSIFTTFKTVILIGYQALKLIFIKKLRFTCPPKQLKNKITINNY